MLILERIPVRASHLVFRSQFYDADWCYTICISNDEMLRISLFHITTTSDLVACNNTRATILNSQLAILRTHRKQSQIRFTHSELLQVANATNRQFKNIIPCTSLDMKNCKFKVDLACKGLCASGFFFMYAILNSTITWIQNGLQDTA